MKDKIEDYLKSINVNPRFISDIADDILNPSEEEFIIGRHLLNVGELNNIKAIIRDCKINLLLK